MQEGAFKNLVAGAIIGTASALGSPEAQAKEPVSAVSQRQDINIDTIATIESNNNPKAVNRRTGARGLCQLMKPTWDEMAKELNVANDWDLAFNGAKNKTVAEYYINVKIPKMLKHFKIPDSVQARLAAYNWGIGNVNASYKKNGNSWIDHLPKETSDYIKKYADLSR